MRKLRAAIVAVTVLFAPLASTVLDATPASAGQDYWSSEPCRPDVLWYNQTGTYGTWYWRYNTSRSYFVGGKVMDVYTQTGWQCGWLGPPTGVYDPNAMSQNFESGRIYFDHWWSCWRIGHPGGSTGCYAW